MHIFNKFKISQGCLSASNYEGVEKEHRLAPHILNQCHRWRLVIIFMFWQFLTKGKQPLVPTVQEVRRVTDHDCSHQLSINGLSAASAQRIFLT